MKIETSDTQPPKLPANRVGSDSGTIVKFLAVYPKPIFAERVVKSVSSDFLQGLILQKET